MASARILRPYLPCLLSALAIALAVPISVWQADAPLPYLPGIALVVGGIEIRNAGRLTLRIPCATVASLRFFANQLEITTADGFEISVATSWYTGRQRDAVVAHLQRA
jgi:hypothetical protein